MKHLDTISVILDKRPGHHTELRAPVWHLSHPLGAWDGFYVIQTCSAGLGQHICAQNHRVLEQALYRHHPVGTLIGEITPSCSIDSISVLTLGSRG